MLRALHNTTRKKGHEDRGASTCKSYSAMKHLFANQRLMYSRDGRLVICVHDIPDAVVKDTPTLRHVFMWRKALAPQADRTLDCLSKNSPRCQ